MFSVSTRPTRPVVLSIGLEQEQVSYTSGLGEGLLVPIAEHSDLYELFLSEHWLSEFDAAPGSFAKAGREEQARLGTRLFEALFPAAAPRRILRQIQGQMAHQEGSYLALRLIAKSTAPPVDRLIALPWEYLYDPEEAAFLCHRPRVTVSRILPGDSTVRGNPRPLRRILWLSPPVSADVAEHSSIVIDRSPSVEIILFSGHDLDTLKLATRPVEILHAATVSGSEGVHLAFGGSSKGLDEIFSATGQNPPRLTFLEKTANHLDGDPHRHAQRALKLGSAAAICLQCPMSANRARYFAQVFYQSLQQGTPIELAMAEARVALAGDGDDSAWGAPALWLRQADEPLFVFDDASSLPGDGEEIDDGDESPDTDSEDEASVDTSTPLEEDDDTALKHPLLQFDYDEHALALLRVAVAFTEMRNHDPQRRKPLRLSSSALLLAFVDPLDRFTHDPDVEFFKRCLGTPFDDGNEKSLKNLTKRWRADATLDLTSAFGDDEKLPPLTANAVSMLQRAQRLARGTYGGPLGSRHLLAGFLTLPEEADDEPLRQPYAHERLRKAGHRLTDLRLRLFDHQRRHWPGDRQIVWEQVLVGHRPRLISRFADDRPQGADRLFVEPYAHALAAVIAAWETPQPLSIGIFGDWGSGKSFFMHLLNGAIEQLKQNHARDDQGRRIFCRNIVQIDFNAWHYAESQIWASLVDHILRSLYKPLGEADARDKLRRLELIGIAKVEAEERLQRAEEALELAEAEKARQLDSGEDIWRIEFWETLPREMVPAKVREGLEVLQDAVGVRETLSSARLAYRQVRGIERARSGILATLGDLWRHPKKPLLAAALALVTLLLLSFLDIASWSESPWWQALGHRLAGFLAVLVAFLTPIAGVVRETWRKLTLVRDWLQANHRRLDTELNKRLKAYQDDVEAARRRVEELEKERDAAQRELEASQSPESVSRFLRQRLADDTYSRHLGVISAVHKDFRTLSDLLLEKAEERRAEEADDDHPASPDDDHHVDRIVLYIDDLDRCPSHTVVQVLEAIHLLLAFDLFVVVVGVDVRWVAQSLSDRYPRHLQTLQDGVERLHGEVTAHDSEHCRATPHDYLEKIFQIPFWLPSMGPQASRNLIRSLTMTQSQGLESEAFEPPDLLNAGIPEMVPNPLHSVSLTSHSEEPAASTGVTSASSAPRSEQERNGVDPSTSATPVRSISELEAADDGRLEPPADDAAYSTTAPQDSQQPGLALDIETVAAAQALSMEDAEIAYMEDLAGAVGRSPRRLKRFVNVYRILKASCTPSEALHFVRDSGHQGEYRAAMTLLALTTGAPSIAFDLYQLLGRQDPVATIGAWLTALEDYPRLHQAPPPEVQAVRQAFNVYRRHHGDDAVLRDLQRWAWRVVRFTFRSGQL